jgi:hypothetical protein
MCRYKPALVQDIQVDVDVALNCQFNDYTKAFTSFLFTDSSGNGAANVQEVASSQATTAWVDLNRNDDRADFYNTPRAKIV